MGSYDGVMSKLPPSSKYLQRGQDAVNEAERDSLSRRASDAFEDGRIELPDYQEAMRVIYAAKTLGDLTSVVEMLPAPAVRTPAIVGVGALPAGQVNQARPPARTGVVLVGAFVGLMVILLTLGILVALLFAH